MKRRGILLIFVLLPFVGKAQNVSTPYGGDTLFVSSPVNKFVHSEQPDTTQLAIAPHNPDKALLLSLLPGAGQVYNHQAWKAPVIYGLLGGLGYFMVSSYQQMDMFKTEYLHRVNGGEPQLDGYRNYPDNSIYNSYQTYNQRFLLSIILSAVVYGLNLVDAYVYGHLFDFQIDDNLSFRVRPSVFQPTFDTFCPSLSCSLYF